MIKFTNLVALLHSLDSEYLNHQWMDEHSSIHIINNNGNNMQLQETKLNMG